jgi:hypothetical protein
MQCSRFSNSITSSARASSIGGTSMPGALACAQIDQELELGRLHDRQVGRFRAFENPPGKDSSLVVRFPLPS